MNIDSQDCEKWFEQLKAYPNEAIPLLQTTFDDPFDKTINDICNSCEERISRWRATHSYTIISPAAADGTSRRFHQFQAYFGKHGLDKWLLSNKPEAISQSTPQEYSDMLLTLQNTQDARQRAIIYHKLYSTSERTPNPNSLEGTIGEKLRVKFRVTPYNPKIAMENMRQIKTAIDSEFGEVDRHQQRTKYTKIAKIVLRSTCHTIQQNLIKTQKSLTKSLKAGCKKIREQTESTDTPSGPRQ